MREALQRAGHEVHIFANESEPELGARPIEQAARFLSKQSGPVIYHQGTEWDEGLNLIKNVRGPLLIRDHNVTPPSFFEGVDESFVKAMQAGKAARLRLTQQPNVTKFLPCSKFSADELKAMGVPGERIAIQPPFNEAAAMEERAPNRATLRQWAREPADILFVGRLAPNKGHRRLLRISAIHRELFGEPLRLRFVGRRHPKLEKWTRLIHREADLLGLQRFVDIAGDVTPAELKSAYLTSRVFACASEHEGFCVPLVEAAWLGLPIVATFQEAVAETLGRAGLIFSSEDLDAIAVTIHRLLQDSEARESISRIQQSWVKENFGTEVLAARFLSVTQGVMA